ncbi:phage tail tube protein [Marilutibacter alkalisoli]|uniref:Uncharacterized protein n=1 Tax=Marilutibacter alkalisoli TaxID=2591633 RepID=A0A514BU64_9GAMM|nr:hypothetical protein [Lysobacter alkalisoli]QDH70845.1 hypothetical protein FKV23_12700 [Lysobacter alkalisoli]
MKDFSFQGRIYLGTKLPSGQPGALTWVGDQSSCEINLNTENVDRTETFSGNRLQSARLRTSTTVELNLVLRYFNPYNVQLGLYSTPQNVTAGSVAGEVLPSGLVVGDRVALQNGANVTNLSIEDDMAAALTAGTHYRRDDANGSVIEILDLGSFVQPLVADYDHDAFTSLPLFTAQPPERYLYMDGINTVDGSRVRAHLYRVQFNPVENLGMINEEFGELPLSGTALFDSDNATDPTLGGFGRFEIPDAA